MLETKRLPTPVLLLCVRHDQRWSIYCCAAGAEEHSGEGSSQELSDEGALISRYPEANTMYAMNRDMACRKPERKMEGGRGHHYHPDLGRQPSTALPAMVFGVENESRDHSTQLHYLDISISTDLLHLA